MLDKIQSWKTPRGNNPLSLKGLFLFLVLVIIGVLSKSLFRKVNLEWERNWTVVSYHWNSDTMICMWNNIQMEPYENLFINFSNPFLTFCDLMIPSNGVKLTCFCLVSRSLCLWNIKKTSGAISKWLNNVLILVLWTTHVQPDHRGQPWASSVRTRHRRTLLMILPRPMGLATLSTCTANAKYWRVL